jgi:predicted RNase H-like HicB family nuclease
MSRFHSVRYYRKEVTIMGLYVGSDPIGTFTYTNRGDEAWFEVPSLNITSETKSFEEALAECREAISPLIGDTNIPQRGGKQ